ncbi:hypothetical protein SBV1_3440002 [Verrucomicrobia bacterium]|nr:hypothetical protein SBV1_3440002 [Verrucomicrobiota bacterium]
MPLCSAKSFPPLAWGCFSFMPGSCARVRHPRRKPPWTTTQRWRQGGLGWWGRRPNEALKKAEKSHFWGLTEATKLLRYLASMGNDDEKSAMVLSQPGNAGGAKAHRRSRGENHGRLNELPDTPFAVAVLSFRAPDVIRLREWK